jgi:hypothetical protein
MTKFPFPIFAEEMRNVSSPIGGDRKVRRSCPVAGAPERNL